MRGSRIYTFKDITVILISRNHADFIKDALQSIYRELGDKVNIIYTDVNSLDLTSKIGNKFLKERFHNVRTQSLNYDSTTLEVVASSITATSTPYFILLSADDVLGQGYGLTVQDILRRIDKPTVVNFGLYYTDRNLKVIKERYPSWANSKKQNKCLLSFRNPGTTPGAILPTELCKSVIQECEVPPILIEDYWFWWKLVDKAAFINIAKPLVLYRQHANNVTLNRNNSTYAFSLGYSAGLPLMSFNPLRYKIVSLCLVPRWIRHIHLKQFKNFIHGYIQSLIN